MFGVAFWRDWRRYKSRSALVIGLFAADMVTRRFPTIWIATAGKPA